MIAAMTKVQVAVPLEDKKKFLAWLQEEEALHIVPLDIKPGVGEETNTAYRLAQVQFGLEFIERIKGESHAKAKRDWHKLFAGKPIASLDELEAAFSKHDVDKNLAAMREASDKLTEAQANQRDLAEEKKLFEPWKNLALHRASTHEHIPHYLLTVSIKNEKALLQDLEALKAASWQEVNRIVSKKSGTVYLEVVAHKKDEAALANLIQRSSAEVVELPLKTSQSPSERLLEIGNEIKSSEGEYRKTLSASALFVQTEDDFKLIYDYLLHQQEREALEQDTAALTYTFVLAGWLPSKALTSFEKRLTKDITAVVEKIEPAKGEQPPIAFQNAKLMRPFEAVTDIYGKPKYNEIDPSPLLSIFFLVSFGLALTDAGYGLIMMAAMFAAERFFKLKRSFKKMVRLLFYAGLSTTIIGSLTGGWFGITLEELPASGIRDALLSIKLIDPISDPITLLLVAFAIGVVQLLFAWSVKGYDLWRRGEKAAAIFDSLAWITLVVLVLSWAGQNALPSEVARVVTALLFANILVMIVMQGREHKNIFLRLGAGVLSLYGLVNFLSDVLSYSRLLALGLATGIIGLVVNLIGGMVIEMVPVVGFAIAVIVLLGGHAFNLGINTLGAFIHSGRLQFVEFFPKFMEGGGSSYKPFGRVSKYVDNPREFA